jgi:uncharacterized protein YneR
MIMTGLRSEKQLILFVALLFLLMSSCVRKDISFGTIPENNYTGIIYTDTVEVKISTVLTDSFATNGDSILLLGRYSDPYLGIVSARPFFQMTVPASIPEIPATAKFDSLSLIIRPNDYYYGDTSKSQTVSVYELANAISYSYNNKLYNTSDVAVKSIPLGTKILRMKPRADDSLLIRLHDAKGSELFSKLQQASTDVKNENDFLNYFRGISLAFGNSDTTAVYGLLGKAGSIVMRVHYHTTIPYPEDKHIDFSSLANDLSFNQVLTNRSGTGLVSGATGRTEIVSSKSKGLSFLQAGTGLSLKMTFPTLNNILTNKNIIKLLRADLMILPAYLSFDKNKHALPQQLYLLQTDESNIAGGTIMDSTGYNVLYANPVIDDIYGENNYYQLNITSYINQLLNTAGSSNKGLFVNQQSSLSATNVDRLIVSNASQSNVHSKLVLSFMVLNQ